MNDRKSTATADAVANLVVLRGRVRGVPVERTLPSAGAVVQFDLATPIVTGGRPSVSSVPVALVDPGSSARRAVTEGAELVVVGSVRRRFFRVGGATQSRTEVVAESVIPARRATQVTALLDRVAAQLA